MTPAAEIMVAKLRFLIAQLKFNILPVPDIQNNIDLPALIRRHRV